MIADLDVDAELISRAKAIHSTAVVIDGSVVINQEPGHFIRAVQGGVTAANHTVTIPDIDLVEALRQVNTFRRWVGANADRISVCTSVDDILRAKESGTQTAILGPQDTRFLGTDLAMLGVFYDLGVRVLQLTYQKRNWAGDGCGELNPAGITSFGRSLVKEMQALGIVLDLSHVSHPTSFDAIDNSDGPVILSHAHANAVTPHLRAKSDDLLRAVAATGGVVGVTALSSFVALEPGVRPGLHAFLRHITYLVDLLGVDHVGIGLDFDETNTPEKHARDLARNPELAAGDVFDWPDRRVAGLTNSGDVGNVTVALLSAGFEEPEIRQLLGLNFLRVFERVWK